MANPRRRTRALRYFGARVWPVGLPETIFRAKLPRQPWQTRAVARAHSVILALGGWPDGLPETSFRAMQSGGILEAAAALCRNTGGPDYQGRGPGQRPQWPFYEPETEKLPDLRAADGRFHIVPYKEFISGQAEPFLGRAGKANGNFIRSGRFIKADGRFIKFYQQWPLYQGRGPGQWPQWPFYQAEWAKLPDLLDSGCGWPISYCPV